MSCGKEKIFQIRSVCPIESYMERHTERYQNLIAQVQNMYFMPKKADYSQGQQQEINYSTKQTDKLPEITYIKQIPYDKGKKQVTFNHEQSMQEKGNNTLENELEMMIKNAREEATWTQ